VNNAGIFATGPALSEDGIEEQFATNHLGHYQLTLGLSDVLIKSAPSRVVNVASNGHCWTYSQGIQLDSLESVNAHSDRFKNYGQSKLANILFSKELAKRLAGKGVFVNAAHPGFVDTDIQRTLVHDLKSFFGAITTLTNQIFIATFALSSVEGSLTQLYLATHPEIEAKNITGQYYIPTARPWTEAGSTLALAECTHAKNMTLADELWKFSALKTGIDL